MNFDDVIIELKTELVEKYRGIFKKSPELLPKNQEVTEKIQNLVLEILKSLAEGKEPVLSSLNTSDWDNCIFDEKIKLKDKKYSKTIKFSKLKSCGRFASIIFLISKIHKLLITNQITTQRKLYYENLDIFKSQQQVDCCIRDVCHILNSFTWELGVITTSKGIVFGPLLLKLKNGDYLDCSKKGGISIPHNIFDIENMSSSASWTLIVEKDASFQQIIANEVVLNLNCIFITSKGYPDINTRLLVCKIWLILQIPILILVDADPYGFEIMCTYRFGSRALSSHSEHLACPPIRWLGVHPSDIKPLLIDSQPLTDRDNFKIQALLKRKYVIENEKLKNQLIILREGNAKAEIEGVSSISTNYLIHVYIKSKIQYKDYF